MQAWTSAAVAGSPGQGQDDHGLTASKAPGGVGGAGRVAQHTAAAGQHLVAGVVAVLVVDGLEPLEFAEQHRG